MTTVNTTDQTETSGDVIAQTTGPDLLPANRSDQQDQAFRVSWFDSLTSFFLALMLFIGTFVVMLVVVWLLDSEPIGQEPQPHPIRHVSTSNPEGLERDFLEPGAVEVEQLAEVQVQDLLLAITESASRVAAAWVTSNSDSLLSDEGDNGVGDSRIPVSPEDGADGIPAFQRWQLNFAARDIHSYARQLDFFEIELGVIGGSVSGVDYISDLSTRPATRRGESESEQRLYFMWNQPGPLMGYDQRLVTQAGVELNGREMLKFIPPELKNRLAQIELEYARSLGRGSVAEIAKTIFESQSAGQGYRFKVIDQRYRKPRK